MRKEKTFIVAVSNWDGKEYVPNFEISKYFTDLQIQPKSGETFFRDPIIWTVVNVFYSFPNYINVSLKERKI